MNKKQLKEALQIWVIPFGLCWLVVSISILSLIPLTPDSIQEKLFVIGIGGVILLTLYTSKFQYERIKKVKVGRITLYCSRVLLIAYLVAIVFALIEIKNAVSN